MDGGHVCFRVQPTDGLIVRMLTSPHTFTTHTAHIHTLASDASAHTWHRHTCSNYSSVRTPTPPPSFAPITNSTPILTLI